MLVVRRGQARAHSGGLSERASVRTIGTEFWTRSSTGQWRSTASVAALVATALGTLALAVATGALAWSTRSDVRATTDLATVARAERADASRPVVILVGGPRFKGPWISLTSGQVALQVGTSAEVRRAMCGSRSNGRNTPASPKRAWRTTPRQLADMGYVAPIRVSRPPHSLSRSTNFWTLPVEVFGSGPNSIASGHL